MKTSVWKKIYGLCQIQSHIPFLQRKQLGQGLIVSKVSYCIEATSCCPKNILQQGSKLLNRTAREICGEFRWENTWKCYASLGWFNLKELSIFRTFVMAQKLLITGSPSRLLRRIAEREGDIWKVKKSQSNCRTALGRRSFGN